MNETKPETYSIGDNTFTEIYVLFCHSLASPLVLGTENSQEVTGGLIRK